MKPKGYDLMDYSDVSSKRQRIGTNRTMGGTPGQSSTMDQAAVLKSFGEYLGMGNSLVQQNQHLFQQPASQQPPQ
jgi:hypothetical protein